MPHIRPGGGSSRTRWRLLNDPPGPAAWNMAVDEALARELGPGEGVLRIYRWSRPSLSFGRNQPARGRYDPSAIRAMGAEVVRRPTGGREVLHDRELTYCVVLGARSLGGLRAAYRTLNEALLQALRSLDISASITPVRGRTPPPDAGPCFGAAAEGEIEVEDRKMVGSAQVRMGGALLQHGSVLLDRASAELTAFEADGMGAPGIATRPGRRAGPDPAGGRTDGRDRRTPAAPVPGISLRETLGRPIAFGRVAAAVEAAMAGALGGQWERDELRRAERGLAADLLPHYESPSWTWRR